ncbi:hypothetical protein PV402_39850 [Streptomyces scabiei]|uniref:hypothetical protein n=1 Tax=Streptomyces scabiei TaxID=1930 RepID=UPI0029A40635|nr:hypothetical protein [Streptomyces scabiei]MDX2658342.1 hypothetical protein [Streptomyces scabiei]MDX2870498.1 hypothetical protein [Streptomyces scabiei]
MTEQNLRQRQEDFNLRAGQAILNAYKVAAEGGTDFGAAVTDPYRELMDAAEDRFRKAAEAEDLQGMADGWNDLTDVLAHVAHANARLGIALLDTMVSTTGLSAEEAMAKTIGRFQSN